MLCELCNYLNRTGVDWAVCGGHAIDLFVGKQIRPHKDVDVAVFWEQRETLLSQLLQDRWRVFEPEDGLLREITSLNQDYHNNHNMWCVSVESDAYRIEKQSGGYYQITTERQHQDRLDFMELLFNHRDGDTLLYRRNREIHHDHPIHASGSGIPYLAPELVLLYQSTNSSYISNSCDFASALPLMNRKQKHWLSHALQRSFPQGHAWIQSIESPSR